MRLVLASLGLVGAGCASPTPPPPAEPAGPSAQMVNALVLTNGCQDLGRQSSVLAEKAMNSLVEGCATVPGGSMEFHATLQPGGRIDIAAAPGQPEVVPICILKHGLLHRVPLTRPCLLDVKIEQTSVTVTAPAPSASPPASRPDGGA